MRCLPPVKRKTLVLLRVGHEGLQAFAGAAAASLRWDRGLLELGSLPQLLHASCHQLDCSWTLCSSTQHAFTAKEDEEYG